MSNTWFKFYPRDWLEGTRSMSLEQRGAYMDCIAIIMDTDNPIPDDPKWLGHKLHVSARKARAILDVLVQAKKLYISNQGFDNEKCRDVRLNRAKISKINSENARRKDTNKSGSEEIHDSFDPRKTHENVAKSSRKETENSEKLNKNNEGKENSLTDPPYTREDIDIDIDITPPCSPPQGWGRSKR